MPDVWHDVIDLHESQDVVDNGILFLTPLFCLADDDDDKMMHNQTCTKRTNRSLKVACCMHIQLPPHSSSTTEQTQKLKSHMQKYSNLLHERE